MLIIFFFLAIDRYTRTKTFIPFWYHSSTETWWYAISQRYISTLLVNTWYLLPSTLDVGLDVEVGEQDDEGYGIAYQRVVHPFWKVAVDVQGMNSVDYSKAELELQRAEKEAYNYDKAIEMEENEVQIIEFWNVGVSEI